MNHLCTRLALSAVLLAGLSTALFAESYCYRVYLKDKGVTEADLHAPERFLSAEAIERRARRMVDITTGDVPIAPARLEALTAAGVRIVTGSKWMATVVVEADDILAANRLKALPAVDSVRLVWQGDDRLGHNECTPDDEILYPEREKTPGDYGHALAQIEMLNGERLHALGKRGQGMRIAVVDAGFLNVNRIAAFADLRLLGTHNVVFPGADVFCDDDHGSKVLSCLAANLPGQMIGTAPEAAYLLIKSEDPRAEYPIEEDFWAAALEYADSVGIDVVSSSLGYYRFDLGDTVYRHRDLDGQTAFISQVAQIAGEKGMLLCVSAGNEGNQAWEKITFPGDAPGVLTVGAVTADGSRSAFSSTGFTADYRVKPDIVALGTNVSIVDAYGEVMHANGTSFSTPVAAGMAACLWQALSWLNSHEIIDLIRQTASQADHPDAEKGYGLPDIYKAYKKELNDTIQ